MVVELPQHITMPMEIISGQVMIGKRYCTMYRKSALAISHIGVDLLPLAYRHQGEWRGGLRLPRGRWSECRMALQRYGLFTCVSARFSEMAKVGDTQRT